MASRSYRRSASYGEDSTCPPRWMWLLAGILIGIFLSFLTYLKEETKRVPPVVTAEAPPTKTTPVDNSKTPIHSAPRFEFYDILPQTNRNPPAEPPKRTLPTPPPKKEPLPVVKETPVIKSVSSSQVLQVGSFRDAQEAEGLKAHLAMLGIRAQVSAVSVESGVWHRVRVGPVKDPDLLNQLETQLRENNISFILQSAD